MIKVINPDAIYWAQEGYDLQSIYNHVARCARVCYQTIPKTDKESNYDFLKRTVLKGKDINNITRDDISNLHLSVFEHGTVHLRIPLNARINDITLDSLIRNKYTKYNLVKESNGRNYYYVTTNMRVIIENNFNEFLKFIDNDYSHVDFYHKRITISIITDIGCSRELNRHRTHSISEESTRYCRYTANKFGNNISILKLPWIDYTDNTGELERTTYESGFYNDNEIFDVNTNVIINQFAHYWNAIDWFLYGIQIANLVYSKCIEFGWTAQQAREILPLNTKTQLVHTAWEIDWNHFLELRMKESSGKVHPVMKDLAERINEELALM